ncbi:MAG: FtsX-like permease family protein, partial [Lapillicoccus sp.]
MLAALRYRWASSLVVMVLAALVSTCLVLAPLYTRALEQATTRTLLHEATAKDIGLSLTSTSSTSSTRKDLALVPDALAQLVPVPVRPFYGAPVATTSVAVRRMPILGQPGGRLLARDGLCDSVRFTSGRCPSSAREIAVSADQARVYAMPVGATLQVGEFDSAVSLPESAPRTTLRVVGVYEPVAGPAFFGDQLTGQAAKRVGYDAMLTPVATLTGDVTGPGGQATSWFQPLYAVNFPLLPGRVGVDQIGPLGSSVRDLVRYPLGAERDGTEVARTVTVSSGLPAIADEVRIGIDPASVTVPLLMAQLALLLACVLWLVLVAAVDQRRAEVAVARLRGRGARGARRLLLNETLPPLVLGAPLGALLAVACSTVARHTVLTSDPPFEVPVGAVVALGGALVLMTGLATLSVRRVSREPVAALLRSVPPRRTGIRLGVLEAMLVAAALAAFAALVTGSVGGVVGQVAPTLLALAVGVVAARVISYALAAGGRLLLRHGRPTAGVALLASSRRTTTRWLVPVVTVALSIAVVSASALAVGARSWTGRAEAEVGAASVLTLDSVDLPAVTRALRAIDPAGAHITPVAVLSATVQGGSATIGVVPDAFRRIALWPGVATSALPLDRLSAPTVPPLVVTGSRITYHVDASALRLSPPVLRAAPTALVVGLRVVRTDGTVASLGLGTLPAAGVKADQAAPVDCADGCRITGIGVLTPRGSASVTGAMTLTRLSIDGRAVDLGGLTSWRNTSVDGASVTGSFSGSPTHGSVRLDYSTNGFDSSFLT